MSRAPFTWKTTRRYVVAFLLVAGQLVAFRPLVQDASAGRSGGCTQTFSTTPLTDLATGTYKGFQGGLYPTGTNVIPRTYSDIGMKRAALVEPLSGAGTPNPNGRIVFLAVGMSNTRMEFASLMTLANADPAVNPDLVLVNGAQPGADASKISDPAAAYWPDITKTLIGGGVTAKQVQVVWLKEAIANENRPFPADAAALRDDLREIVVIMRDRFPNLRLVYLASRSYGGYATIPLNPEPFAFESGFAVKWLIEQDVATPAAEQPWLAWGPYFWTNGLLGRSDGFVWTCADVAADGTHPSPTGSTKLAQQLLGFFEQSPTTKTWFTAGG